MAAQMQVMSLVASDLKKKSSSWRAVLSVDGTSHKLPAGTSKNGEVAWKGGAMAPVKFNVPPSPDKAKLSVILRKPGGMITSGKTYSSEVPLTQLVDDEWKETAPSRHPVKSASGEWAAAEKAEAERVAAEKAEAEKAAAKEAAAKKAAAEKAAAEKAIKQAAMQKAAVEKAEVQRIAAEQMAEKKAAMERMRIEKVAKENAAKGRKTLAEEHKTLRKTVEAELEALRKTLAAKQQAVPGQPAPGLVGENAGNVKG
eukprot:gene6183-7412_t